MLFTLGAAGNTDRLVYHSIHPGKFRLYIIFKRSCSFLVSIRLFDTHCITLDVIATSFENKPVNCSETEYNDYYICSRTDARPATD